MDDALLFHKFFLLSKLDLEVLALLEVHDLDYFLLIVEDHVKLNIPVTRNSEMSKEQTEFTYL